MLNTFYQYLLCMYIPFYLCMSLPFYLCMFLPFYLCMSIPFYLCMSIPFYLCMSLPFYLPINVSYFLPTYVCLLIFYSLLHQRAAICNQIGLQGSDSAHSIFCTHTTLTQRKKMFLFSRSVKQEKRKLIVLREQCDQMVRLFSNIWPFATMNICPIM